MTAMANDLIAGDYGSVGHAIHEAVRTILSTMKPELLGGLDIAVSANYAGFPQSKGWGNETSPVRGCRKKEQLDQIASGGPQEGTVKWSQLFGQFCSFAKVYLV
jgi:hypothetical protein